MKFKNKAGRKRKTLLSNNIIKIVRVLPFDIGIYFCVDRHSKNKKIHNAKKKIFLLDLIEMTGRPLVLDETQENVEKKLLK